MQNGIEEAKIVGALLNRTFEQHQWDIMVKDRHSYGYRATHIIVKHDKKSYEIQLRTFAQNYWANLVESLSDKENTLKYGGSKEEQPLIRELYLLSEQLSKVDEYAHILSFKEYSEKIEEVVNSVLSH